MNEKEIKTALNRSKNTVFFPIFEMFANKHSNCLFNDPFDFKKNIKLIDKLESKYGYKLPIDYLNFLNITNGGKFNNIFIYPLTIIKKDISLEHYKNELSKKYKINFKKTEVVFGNNEDLIFCFDVTNDNYIQYCLYEISTKKKVFILDQLVQLFLYEMNESI